MRRPWKRFLKAFACAWLAMAISSAPLFCTESTPAVSENPYAARLESGEVVAPVPKPASLLLIGAGLIGLALLRRRV